MCILCVFFFISLVYLCFLLERLGYVYEGELIVAGRLQCFWIGCLIICLIRDSPKTVSSSNLCLHYVVCQMLRRKSLCLVFLWACLLVLVAFEFIYIQWVYFANSMIFYFSTLKSNPPSFSPQNAAQSVCLFNFN